MICPRCTTFVALLCLLFGSSAQLLYRNKGPISFSSNNCPGTVSIPDEFEISFDLRMDSWYSGTSTRYLHLWDIDSGSIFLRYSSDGGVNWLYFGFGDQRIPIDSFNIDQSNNGQTFHIQTQVTQTHINVGIDGETVLDTDKEAHETLNNTSICFAYSDSSYHDGVIKSGQIFEFNVVKTGSDCLCT